MLSSTTVRATVLGSGSAGPISFPFRVFAATDLDVRKTSTLGSVTQLAYPTDYTVAGVGDAAGGTLTLTVALATGETLSVVRATPKTQNTSLRALGTFLPGTHEDAFDRLTALVQEHDDAIRRAARLPSWLDPSLGTMELTPAPGKALVWNSDGTALSNLAVSTVFVPTNAVDIRSKGIVGDGADEGAAINTALAALAAAGNRAVYFPYTEGGYGTSVMILVPTSLSVYCDPTAVIRATTTIAGPVVKVDPSAEWGAAGWYGGTIDAANKADGGLVVGRPAESDVANLRILSPKNYGLKIGDPAATSTGFSCWVSGVRVSRDKAFTVPAGSYGIWVSRPSDCKILFSHSIGYETGVRYDVGGTWTHQVHCWAYPQTAGVYDPAGAGTMITGFDDTVGGNIFTMCYADTATQYGFRMRGFGNLISMCKVYNGDAGGTNNQLIGIYFDQAGGPFSTVANVSFHASGTAGHAILQDIKVNGDATNALPNLKVTGCIYANTITTTVGNTDRFANVKVGGTATITGQLTTAAQINAQAGLTAAATVGGTQLAATATGVTLDGASQDGLRSLRLYNVGVLSWALGADSGVAVGWSLRRYNQSTGALIDEPMWFDPATGDAQLRHKLSVAEAFTATTSVRIGTGTPLTGAVVYTPTITPASVGAATVAEQTFSVPGLTTADKVIVNPPAIGNATGIVGARVSAADTLAIRFVNPTAGALTPSSGVYTVLAFRS